MNSIKYYFEQWQKDNKCEGSCGLSTYEDDYVQFLEETVARYFDSLEYAKHPTK